MPRSGPNPPSLRGRLLALLLSGAVAAWALIAVATYLDARVHLTRMLDAQLVEYSEVLAVIADHEALEIGGATTRHDPASARSSCTYQVFSVEGALLMRSHDAPDAALAPAEGFSDVRAAGADWRAFRRTDRALGLVTIVAHDVAERDAVVRDLAARMLVPVAIGLPLLAIVLWLAVTRALRPLERLAQEVRDRDASRLTPIERANAPAEVAPLVTATNELLARLERSFENERRFTGDAAHELRTPLAALRTQAEVALSTASDERRERALGHVVAGVERATRLVEQMLTLARMEAGDAAAHFGTEDLAAVCREAIAGYAEAARERHIDLSLHASGEPLEVRGDAVMLLALVRNLIDNALRFAPDSGRVRLTLRREDGHAAIDVEDSGPGAPEEVRARMFDRFYRAPDGRGQGSGLGLSIARRVVELHHGRIAAASSPALGGLRVEVRLPAQP